MADVLSSFVDSRFVDYLMAGDHCIPVDCKKKYGIENQNLMKNTGKISFIKIDNDLKNSKNFLISRSLSFVSMVPVEYKHFRSELLLFSAYSAIFQLHHG